MTTSSTKIATEKAATRTAQPQDLGRGSESIRHRPWWRITAETILVSALAAAGLECFFNMAGVGQQEFFEPDQVLGSRHIPSKQVTWRLEGLSRDSFNSFGMRDIERTLAKPPGAKRIAVIGDSAVEGLQVPLKDTFPRVLENELKAKYEVLNFGCAGYSTAQEVVQYETQITRFDPDVVVLFFNQGDAVESIVQANQRDTADPKPYFYLDSRGELREDDSIMLANAKKLAPNPVLDWLRRNSRLYGVLSQTNFSLTVNEARYVKLKKSLSALEKKVSPPSALANAPDYPRQDANKVAERLIVRLGNDVQKRGGRFVLVMFPNILKYPDLFVLADRLKKLAATQGYDYLDLTESFVNHPKTNDLFVQVHFSEKGHKLVADKLKEVLER